MALILGMSLLGACRTGNDSWPTGFKGTGAAATTGEGGDFLGGDGGGDAAPECTAGACVPSAAGPFVRVTMVSFGKPEEVRPCPAWAPLAFEGYAGMTVEPHTCPACSCGPATCALPEPIHASAAKCPAIGAPLLAWDAPPSWEGTCIAEEPIAAGLQCSGVPCVQSITLDSVAVSPCSPKEEGAAQFPPPYWSLMARECKINVGTKGCAPGESCSPTPPEGFALCVSVAGDGYECPAEYPNHVLVYDTVDDARGCSPCSCGDPEGADCSALVSIFSDGACAALLGTYMITNDEVSCHDLPSGVGLSSKSAEFVIDKPGTCAQTGGAPSGEMHPTGPVTFCCQPPAGAAE